MTSVSSTSTGSQSGLTARANQLEASELDAEVHSLFVKQLVTAVKYLPVRVVVSLFVQ